MSLTTRPDATEHVPYFGRYTTLVPDGSIAETLRKQRDETAALLARVPAALESHQYVPAGRFEARTLASLAAEYQAVRESTLQLLEGLDEAALPRRGTASENPVSARALFWIVAGHERHHVALLRERYGLR